MEGSRKASRNLALTREQLRAKPQNQIAIKSNREADSHQHRTR
eukprot:COSAG01_NODE_6434_length_3669_cov_1.916527_9_plen_42_part_01